MDDSKPKRSERSRSKPKRWIGDFLNNETRGSEEPTVETVLPSSPEVTEPGVARPKPRLTEGWDAIVPSPS